MGLGASDEGRRPIASMLKGALSQDEDFRAVEERGARTGWTKRIVHIHCVGKMEERRWIWKRCYRGINWVSKRSGWRRIDLRVIELQDRWIQQGVGRTWDQLVR